MNDNQDSIVKMLWSVQMDGSPTTGFKVVGNLLTLLATKRTLEDGTTFPYLLAFDIENGNLLWSYTFDKEELCGIEVEKSYNNSSRIFVTSSVRDFFFDKVFVRCFDRYGNQSWEWQAEFQTISAPTVYEEALYFTVDSEVLISLNSKNGSENNRAKISSSVSFAAPNFQNGLMFIPGNGSYVLAITPNGSLRWQFQSDQDAWFNKSFCFTNKIVFASGSNGILFALNQVDGTKLWKKSVVPTTKPLSPPATDGEKVYVGAEDGLHSLDTITGVEVWRFPTKRSVTAQPYILDEVVYATCHDNNLYALNVNTGDMLWKHQMESSIKLSPLVLKIGEQDKLRIYILDRGGNFVALENKLSQEVINPSLKSKINSAKNIQQLLEEGEITLAAEALYKIGDLEQAAEKYELADKWQQAAELWKKLGRYNKYAQALEGYAHSIEDIDSTVDERISAWKVVADAYEADGEQVKAEYCRIQIAKHENEPILDLSVRYDGLVHNVWSELELTVMNQGFGPARRIGIGVDSEQFSGQIASSKCYFKLFPGKQKLMILTLRPLQYGDSVPLTVTLNFQDNKLQMRQMKKTVFVPVSPKVSDRMVGQIRNIFSTTIKVGKGTKSLTDPSEKDLSEIRRNLAVCFNISELNDLCFELNIDSEELIQSRKSDFAREIVLYLTRRGRLHELISVCTNARPHINW
jgi:outer membrane protein assembly factor BamB